MRRDLNRLLERTFDVLVVGGGISGACVAHDAALRGLSVALVERGDFGAATSAASSHILHGGIRYLPICRFDKLYESAMERAAFLSIAPHLIRIVPFVVPESSIATIAALRAVALLYEMVVSRANRYLAETDRRISRGYWVDAGELRRMIAPFDPPDPVGAYVVPEAFMPNAERMTLAFVQTAVANGAAAANYVRATRLHRGASGTMRVDLHDELEAADFTAEARLVINAAGPWLNTLTAPTGSAPAVWRTKGVHVVARQLLRDVALAVPSRHRARTVVGSRHRRLFVIPWNDHSLIGTTSTTWTQDPDRLAADADDVETLVEGVRQFLPESELSGRDVVRVTAGLLPTNETTPTGRTEYSVDYRICHHRGDLDGVISIVGARFTSARALAEKTVNAVQARLGRPVTLCRTRTTPLAGGAIDDRSRFRTATMQALGVDDDIAQHLIESYGTNANRVVSRTPGSPAVRVSPNCPVTTSEIAYAVREEMAVRLSDVVIRRTGFGATQRPREEDVRMIAAIMAALLGWSERRSQQEIELLRSTWNTPYRLSMAGASVSAVPLAG